MYNSTLRAYTQKNATPYDVDLYMASQRILRVLLCHLLRPDLVVGTRGTGR